MTDHFFRDMEGFHSFSSIADPAQYQNAPSDWCIVVTDVQGSTRAIEAGRYKDVNIIGAATLASLRNAVPDLELPFVFGGDGATALFPASRRTEVEKSLSGLRQLSQSHFNLTLRVGVITVPDLTAECGAVKVGKLLLEGGYPLAVFQGGALAKADELIKGNQEQYEVKDYPHVEPNLKLLSCRWKPMPAARGRVLSLLLIDPLQRMDVYATLISDIDRCVGLSDGAANPARYEAMHFRSLGELLRHDLRYQSSLKHRLGRMCDSVFYYALVKLGFFHRSGTLQHYAQSTAKHSDYRKFDDALRMVIDCSPDQVQTLRQILTQRREEYGICYGTHESDCALMTCFVPGFKDGQHIHFLDGSGGGYALAAKELKAQLKATHL